MGGPHQRGCALFVASVHASVVLQEQVHHFEVSKMGGLNQGRAPVVVGDVHLSSGDRITLGQGGKGTFGKSEKNTL